MRRLRAPLGVLCDDADEQPDSPLLHVWGECGKCGAVIHDHVYDMRSTDTATIQANGKNDGLLMEGHWAKAHPAELVLHNLRLGR